MIRVFVAATPAEWLPLKVLEFSMRETSSSPITVEGIAGFGVPIPMPRDRRNRPRTPFSFQRFLIPAICANAGRAIYLDADMQVFADIAEVWNASMGQHDLLTVATGTQGRKGQFSVMLLDCERLRWDIEAIVRGLDEGRYTYEQLMHEMCVTGSVGAVLDPAWNSLEHHEPGKTRLLHYTDMDTQPWVSLNNPLEHLWLDCLRRSLAAGFICANDLAQEIAAGHVRPSLATQLADMQVSRRQLLAMDRGFVAPYRSLRSGKSRPWISLRSGMAFYARRGLQRLRELAGR